MLFKNSDQTLLEENNEQKLRERLLDDSLYLNELIMQDPLYEDSLDLNRNIMIDEVR